MSDINNIKSMLEGIFLRDRGNLDEATAQLLKSDLCATLEKYFVVEKFDVSFSLCDGGKVDIAVKSTGRRLRKIQSE